MLSNSRTNFRVLFYSNGILLTNLLLNVVLKQSGDSAPLFYRVRDKSLSKINTSATNNNNNNNNNNNSQTASGLMGLHWSPGLSVKRYVGTSQQLVRWLNHTSMQPPESLVRR